MYPPVCGEKVVFHTATVGDREKKLVDCQCSHQVELLKQEILSLKNELAVVLKLVDQRDWLGSHDSAVVEDCRPCEREC